MAVNPSASKQDCRCLKKNTDIVEKHGSTYAKLTKIRYTWKIHNYSFLQKQTGDYLLSPIFSAGANNEYSWRLEFYPNGHIAAFSDYFSLYLGFIPSEKQEAEAEFRISLLNDKKHEINVKSCPMGKFNFPRSLGLGLGVHAKKSLLHDAENYLLTNDCLTILCDISINDGTVEISGTEKSKVREWQFLDDLSDLFESLKHSDVTLVTPGREFQAHKVILAMRSRVFSAMFQHDMVEQKESRVDIDDVDDAVLMELLRFIYTGKIQNLDKIAEGLLPAADKYELESLKLLCEKALSKGLTIENAASLLILADLHSCTPLKARALVFIGAHINEIFETSSYKSMCDTNPHLINEAFRAFVAPEAIFDSTIVARK